MKDRDERALRGVRLWLDVAALSALTDRELLDRFAAGGDHPAQLAFAALVNRHGPMVLRACRAVLRDAHAAEDAFQATFLVLARRGGSLWLRESLGPWLHRVATRVSARLRATTGRRERHEKRAAESRVEAREGEVPEDIGPIIHAEIDRLPDRYRGPVVLCDLEGLTHEEAAARLGCPVGTVKSRLSRAREWLRARLERRGVLPAVGGLGAVLGGQAAHAVPPQLAQAAVGAADLFAASGSSAVGTVPPAVITLAEREIMTMSLHKLAIRAAVLLMGALATTGVLVLAADRPAPRPDPVANTAPVAAPAPPAKPIPKELQPFQGFWKVELCDSAAEGFGAPQKDVGKWRWTVRGDEITWGRQGEEWKLSLKVDPDKKPMEIDLTHLSGPFRGEKALGMYEWGGTDGKTLMISIQDPGADVPRPNRIEMRGDGQTALIFLRRMEPIDPEKELTALQGTWTVDNVQTDAWPKPIGKLPDATGRGSERRWVIKGNEIAWTGLDGKEVKASFKIEPNKVPSQIDFTFLSGPHKGEECPGVYEWVGADRTVLWLCLADPGSKTDRPKDISFASNEGRSWIALSASESRK